MPNNSISNATSLNKTAGDNNAINPDLFIGFGSVALILNVTIILILASKRELFKKSAFLVGLSVGDVLFGLGLVVAGNRIIQNFAAGLTPEINVHPIECLKQCTSLFLIGVQLPASVIFLVGGERLLGVVFFQWYYTRWSLKLSWMLVLVAYFFCFLSVSTIWLIVYQAPENELISISCKTPTVIGPIYGTYNYGLPVVCGISAVISTIMSLVAFIRKRSNMKLAQTDAGMKRFIRSQVQMTMSMLIIAIIDFALVVIPNFLMLLISYGVPFPPALAKLAGYAQISFCTRASLSIFVYFVLNRDFRSAALKLVHIKSSNEVSSQSSKPNSTTRAVVTVKPTGK